MANVTIERRGRGLCVPGGVGESDTLLSMQKSEAQGQRRLSHFLWARGLMSGRDRCPEDSGDFVGFLQAKRKGALFRAPLFDSGSNTGLAVRGRGHTPSGC